MERILTLDDFERQNYSGNYHTSLDFNAGNILITSNGSIIKNKSYKCKSFTDTPNHYAKSVRVFNSTEDIARKIGLNWTIPKPIKKKMTRTEKRKLGLI